MKNISKVILSILFTTGTFSLYAQEEINEISNAAPESKFILKGGLNYSTITRGDFDEGPDPRTSFYIGFAGEIPVTENIFAIQPELIYSRQGFETNTTILGTNYNTKYKIDYLNMPIIAKLYLGRAFNLEVGPQFGLKINEKVGDENGGNESNNVKDFDTALALGFSFNFDAGAFINARFTQSLNEVVENSNSKNMVFQLGIGFKL
jgi:hypothetical protein